MTVFDFNSAPEDKQAPVCTYHIFYTDESETSPEKPILVLDSKGKNFEHHSCGMFTNPVKRTAERRFSLKIRVIRQFMNLPLTMRVFTTFNSNF